MVLQSNSSLKKGIYNYIPFTYIIMVLLFFSSVSEHNKAVFSRIVADVSTLPECTFSNGSIVGKDYVIIMWISHIL